MRTLLDFALVFALAAVPVFCQGGFEGPATYEITNRKSNKVIDLDRHDRTTVIQYESRGTDNQRWEIRNADRDYFYFINLMTGQALEAAGSREHSAVRGAPFRQGDSQQWRIESGRDGSAVIANRNGGILDVAEGSRDNGARLQIFSPNNSGAQQFTFRRVGQGAGRPGQGGFTGSELYEIINRNSNKVVDLDRNNGTNVIQWDSTGADNQQWATQDAGDGYVYIVNRMNGHALEATGSRNHSAVRGTPLRRTESQQWRLESGMIINRNGAALDVSEGSRDNGAQLQMFKRNDSPAQKFELRRLSGPTPVRRRAR
jgi:hypothetical protein